MSFGRQAEQMSGYQSAFAKATGSSSAQFSNTQTQTQTQTILGAGNFKGGAFSGANLSSQTVSQNTVGANKTAQINQQNVAQTAQDAQAYVGQVKEQLSGMAAAIQAAADQEGIDTAVAFPRVDSGGSLAMGFATAACGIPDGTSIAADAISEAKKGGVDRAELVGRIEDRLRSNVAAEGTMDAGRQANEAPEGAKNAVAVLDQGISLQNILEAARNPEEHIPEIAAAQAVIAEAEMVDSDLELTRDATAYKQGLSYTQEASFGEKAINDAVASGGSVKNLTGLDQTGIELMREGFNSISGTVSGDVQEPLRAQFKDSVNEIGGVLASLAERLNEETPNMKQETKFEDPKQIIHPPSTANEFQDAGMGGSMMS